MATAHLYMASVHESMYVCTRMHYVFRHAKQTPLLKLNTGQGGGQRVRGGRRLKIRRRGDAGCVWGGEAEGEGAGQVGGGRAVCGVEAEAGGKRGREKVTGKVQGVSAPVLLLLSLHCMH